MQDDNNSKTQKKQQEIIEKLQKQVALLREENKRLKSRIVDFQPHKHKNLRLPNQKKIQQLFRTFKMKKYALKVCYLGFFYDGMAYQKMTDNNTVEAYILKAMHTMSLIAQPNVGEDYTRAGRTDKGVSAMGNVIALKMRSNQLLDPQKKHDHKQIDFCSMLNAILPEDIRILACQQVEDQFNARYWCTQRSYKYFFAKNNLNIEAMKEGIKAFVGTHNFINYCKMNLCNTVNFQRTIFSAQIVKSDISQDFETDTNQVYYFHFVANSFLWHQIRYMSSALFLVGQGKQSPQLIADLLDLNKFPKKPNYPMAPQYPLILQDCEYPQIKLVPKFQTVLSFYKTFNQMVMRKSTEKTLIINCMKLAQRDLMKSTQITYQAFYEKLKEKEDRIFSKKGKTLAMHKSSGRTFDEAKDSLKGKKKQLFMKKMQRQIEYEEKLKEKQDQAKQQQLMEEKEEKFQSQAKQQQIEK